MATGLSTAGKAAIVLGLGLAKVSGVLALVATTPTLAAKLFGPGSGKRQVPADIGLEARDVEYVPGQRAWWIPTPNPVAAFVIIHGFEPTDDPRSTDPAPRLEVAKFLADHGYSSLVINLGYASGAHRHSGGPLEADDIALAAEWVRTKSGLDVGLYGFSAGGHAAVAAASDCVPFAVVTDSSFVSFDEVVRAQAHSLLRIPPQLLGLTSPWMRILTGRTPTTLTPADFGSVPMLHIHGDADTAIPYSNLDRLAGLSGGETLTIPGGDHLDGFSTDTEQYKAALLSFLEGSMATAAGTGD